MHIPDYPASTPLIIEHRAFLDPLLKNLENGISEFTFANLYLFRNHYRYRLSKHETKAGYTFPIITGTETHDTEENHTHTFTLLPLGFPGLELIKLILDNHCYIKNFPEQAAEIHRIILEQNGYRVEQDRNNFDYIYSRKDLADLNGRKFHKKRNLVNAFINNYAYVEQLIDPGRHKPHLMEILDTWRSGREDSGDYDTAIEAIERFDELGLRGCITYANGRPCAFSMGELIMHGSMFAIHFEKAAGNYNGIYQFINRSFADMLVDCVEVINREQDLGDSGLRQAKMSYRPTGFIKKYRITHSEFGPCEVGEKTEADEEN